MILKESAKGDMFMGRKRAKQAEVEEQKGFEYLSGTLTPDWWHKADKLQLQYDEAIDHFDVVMLDARAGTGKTTITVMKALDYLRRGAVDVIRYVRFVDSRTQKLGAIPGDPAEKQKVFMFPFYEAMAECGIPPEHVDAMVTAGLIELSTDIYFRGRNVKRSFYIIDEAQNGDIEDLRLVLTRPHDDGKVAVIGHSKQVDRKLPKYGKDKLIPFQVYQKHMDKERWTMVCTLLTDHRGKISRWADEIELTLKELEL